MKKIDCLEQLKDCLIGFWPWQMDKLTVELLPISPVGFPPLLDLPPDGPVTIK